MTAPAPVAMRARKDYLSVPDLTHADLRKVLDLAVALKRDRAAGRFAVQPLAHRQVALMFEKPSLRTRMTFMVAVRELGGDVIEMPADIAFGGRESLQDVARNIERWVSAVVARTFEQAKLAAFAAAASRLHVVNALTNEEHPCQALADMLTLEEHAGPLAGRVLAYVGDGNNVATSLAQAGVMLGLHVRIATPEGFDLRPEVVSTCRALAADGATLTLVRDPREAVADADAVYTDVWTSMGQEADSARREALFRPYQVNDALMAFARPGALFMHCLPAHRGLEVTDAVIDSPASVVFDQAENRLHSQKALLALLFA